MDVDAIAVAGYWIRHVPHASELLGRAPVATDGRWQRASVARALYLADEPDTAIAEWYRVLAELGLPPARRIPHDHHIWAIDLKLADLSQDARLTAVGLDLPRPARRTWPAFQAVGEQLWRDGWPGLVAPSAARPQSLIACVFDDGDWPPAGCHPLRTVQITSVPPPPRGMTT